MVLGSENGSRRVQSVISGDSCSEINVFRAREATTFVVLRGASHLALAVVRLPEPGPPGGKEGCSAGEHVHGAQSSLWHTVG